jgi:hypothetical protein
VATDRKREDFSFFVTDFQPLVTILMDEGRPRV